ncbi:MAG: hypothetical protein V4659_01060 [Pseudomonadota bacterium]
MDFLLLLSALFTALTGAVSGARAPVAAAQQVARVTVVEAAGMATSPVAGAPAQVFDVVGARLSAVAVMRLPRLELPAYASRRRE